MNTNQKATHGSLTISQEMIDALSLRDKKIGKKMVINNGTLECNCNSCEKRRARYGQKSEEEWRDDFYEEFFARLTDIETTKALARKNGHHYQSFDHATGETIDLRDYKQPKRPDGPDIAEEITLDVPNLKNIAYQMRHMAEKAAQAGDTDGENSALELTSATVSYTANVLIAATFAAHKNLALEYAGDADRTSSVDPRFLIAGLVSALSAIIVHISNSVGDGEDVNISQLSSILEMPEELVAMGIRSGAFGGQGNAKGLAKAALQSFAVEQVTTHFSDKQRVAYATKQEAHDILGDAALKYTSARGSA